MVRLNVFFLTAPAPRGVATFSKALYIAENLACRR